MTKNGNSMESAVLFMLLQQTEISCNSENVIYFFYSYFTPYFASVQFPFLYWTPSFKKEKFGKLWDSLDRIPSYQSKKNLEAVTTEALHDNVMFAVKYRKHIPSVSDGTRGEFKCAQGLLHTPTRKKRIATQPRRAMHEEIEEEWQQYNGEWRVED